MRARSAALSGVGPNGVGQAADADGGALNIASGVILPEWERSVRLVAAGGSAVAKRVTVARLRSAWPLVEV